MDVGASWAIFAAAGTAFLLQLAVGLVLLVWGRRVARRAATTRKGKAQKIA